MRTLKFYSYLVSLFIFSNGLLTAQNPVSIIYEGVLTDSNGAFVSQEDCIVRLSITNSNDLLLFINEISVTTSDLGAFIFSAENLKQLPAGVNEQELATIEIIIRPKGRASWIESDELKITYDLTQNGPDDYSMLRQEGEVLNYSMQKPVWEFSDIYPLEMLSSRFMISFSNEITDKESIILICKTMKGGEDVEKAEPSPSKRSIKGGYAVGGYKK
ncbi:hypothetical protein ACFLRQ_01520 [Bacteroidota bacterium]